MRSTPTTVSYVSLHSKVATVTLGFVESAAGDASVADDSMCQCGMC